MRRTTKGNERTAKNLVDDFETQKISGQDNHRTFMTEEDPMQIELSKKTLQNIAERSF
jgi:translation elongation factor P/translation initiation factor 5A